MRRQRKFKKLRGIIRDTNKYIMAAALVVILMATIFLAVMTLILEEEDRKEIVAAETTEVSTEIHVIQPENIEVTKKEIIPATVEYTYPFNATPDGWENDLSDFKQYKIPEEYTADGGYFPDIMQQYTFTICKQNGIEYAKVLALIETESAYKWDAIGNADDVGYMQIIQKYHNDRMERLQCYNLLDPFQNIRVGVDYLAELLEKYNGDYEKVFTAYQCGTYGAYKYWFSAGVNASPYAKQVIERADRIEAELEVAQNDTH